MTKKLIPSRAFLFLILKIFSFSIFLFISLMNSASSEEDFGSAGSDKERIELEDKLLVPMEKAREVWNFLENRYVRDQGHLKKIDSGFTSYWNLEEFWDTYYDTPSFQLYAMKSGVRYRRRVNHTNVHDRKSGRELIQIKLNDISESVLARGEIKFNVRHPQRLKSPEDSHPLLGLVDSKQRDDFKLRLRELGLDAHVMKPILTVHDMRKRIYILKNNHPFMSISLDSVDAVVWWAKAEFIEIEPELNEIVYTDADPQTRQYMEEVVSQIVAEIRAEFPFIEQNLTPKYNKSLNAIQKQMPFFPVLVKTNLNNAKGFMLLLLVLFGSAAIVILFSLKLLGNSSSQETPLRSP